MSSAWPTTWKAPPMQANPRGIQPPPLASRGRKVAHARPLRVLRLRGARAHQRDKMKIQELTEPNDLTVLQTASLRRALHHLFSQMFDEVRCLSLFWHMNPLPQTTAKHQRPPLYDVRQTRSRSNLGKIVAILSIHAAGCRNRHTWAWRLRTRPLRSNGVT